MLDNETENFRKLEKVYFKFASPDRCRLNLSVLIHEKHQNACLTVLRVSS